MESARMATSPRQADILAAARYAVASRGTGSPRSMVSNPQDYVGSPPRAQTTNSPGSRQGRRNSMLTEGPVTGGHTEGTGVWRGPMEDLKQLNHTKTVATTTDVIAASQYALSYRAATNKAGNMKGYVALLTGHFGNGVGPGVATYNEATDDHDSTPESIDLHNGQYSPQKAAARAALGVMYEPALPTLPTGFRTAAAASLQASSPKKASVKMAQHSGSLGAATLVNPVDLEYSTETSTYGSTLEHVTMQLGLTAKEARRMGTTSVSSAAGWAYTSLLDADKPSTAGSTLSGSTGPSPSRGGRRRNSILADGPITGAHSSGTGAYRGPVADFNGHYTAIERTTLQRC